MRLFYGIAILWCCSFKTITEEKPVQLKWENHFKGIPNNSSPFYAETRSTFNYQYTVTLKNGEFELQFKFFGGVDSLYSWVKKDKITDPKISKQLLNHEQGHANIGFLFLKEGEIKISSQNYTAKNYKSLIEKTYKEVSTFYEDLQKRYDEETQHGRNLLAQKKWDDEVANELRKYNQ